MDASSRKRYYPEADPLVTAVILVDDRLDGCLLLGFTSLLINYTDFIGSAPVT